MALKPDDPRLAQWQTALLGDPEYQRVLHDPAMDERTRSGTLQYLLHSRYPEAQGWHVDPMNGQLRQASNGGWKYVAIAGALAATAGIAGGAFAGGAAAAGAGGGTAATGGTSAAGLAALPAHLGGTGAVTGAGIAGGGASVAGAGASAATLPASLGGASTGGTMASIMGNAQRFQQVGQVINGINTGRQQGRMAETFAQQNQDNNENRRYANSITAADLNLGAGDRRAATSVKGDILANAQPFRYTGGTHMVGNAPVPNHTGGLSPDIYSQNTRDLGGLLSAQALQGQQTNDGRAIEPQAPLTPIPRANAYDKILGAAGTFSSLMGAMSYGRR